MKRFIAPLPPDDPLMKQALDAMKLYYEAMDAGESEEIIEQHKLKAEALFQAINDYYQRSMGAMLGTLH